MSESLPHLQLQLLAVHIDKYAQPNLASINNYDNCGVDKTRLCLDFIVGGLYV